MVHKTLDRIFKLNETYSPYHISKNHKINILEYDLGETTFGFTMRNSRRNTIVLNSEISENLKEFVLCHELGHCFLHKDLSTPFMRQIGAPSQISKIESEANRFAFGLLKRYYSEMQFMTPEQIVNYYELPKYMINYL